MLSIDMGGSSGGCHAMVGLIFGLALPATKLDPSKKIADHWYKADPSCCHLDYGTPAQKKVLGAAHTRHKTAILVVDQIRLQNGRPGFQIDDVED
eukprot:11388953-Ditylum_brightwellii.AAC.1